NQTGQTATGLGAATYTVFITDANGCASTATAVVTQPSLLTAATSYTTPVCNGESTGIAWVTPSGGIAGYTYLWSASGQTGQTATNLAALISYNVIVTYVNVSTDMDTVIF